MSKSFSTDTNKSGSYGEKDVSSLTDSQLQHAIHQLQHDPAHQLWLQPVREEEVIISLEMFVSPHYVDMPIQYAAIFKGSDEKKHLFFLILLKTLIVGTRL